ncbi:hypothetical protein [Colwellia sp. BRX10-4]
MFFNYSRYSTVSFSISAIAAALLGSVLSFSNAAFRYFFASLLRSN